MYYTYILKSERDRKLYVGCTKDLRKRIAMHNSRKVFSTHTRAPLRLIYYEAFLDKRDAFAREQWLKTGWRRNHLQKILAHSLKI